MDDLERPLSRFWPEGARFSEGAGSGLGRVSLAGFQQGSHGVGRNMRVLGEFGLVLVLGGGGFYGDAEGEREVRAGDAILVLPERAHFYGPRRSHKSGWEKWDEFFVVFSGPLFEAWREHGWLSRAGVWAVARGREEIESALHLLLSIFERGEDGFPRAVVSREESLHQTVRLQSALASLLHPAPRTGDEEWLARASRLLEAEGAHGAARALGVSYEVFRKKWARLSGTSPARFVAGRKCERAQELLYRGLGHRRIASELGFCDEFHFSRTFKKVTGVAPRDWARRRG